MKSPRLLGLPGITAASLLLMFVALASSPLAAKDDRSRIKNFQHVFIIMMENTGFDSLMGNPNAPFTNAAAANYGLASNYFGVTHPSQPNYIAATSGATNGVAEGARHRNGERRRAFFFVLFLRHMLP
jgi:phospholipase C